MNKKEIYQAKLAVNASLNALKNKESSIYTCHLIDRYSGNDYKILQNYQKFLVENYPMFFDYDQENNGYVYIKYQHNLKRGSLEYKIFNPNVRNLEMRKGFLESYLNYLDTLS